jgi:hypothetical protein
MTNYALFLFIFEQRKRKIEENAREKKEDSIILSSTVRKSNFAINTFLLRMTKKIERKMGAKRERERKI